MGNSSSANKKKEVKKKPPIVHSGLCIFALIAILPWSLTFSCAGHYQLSRTAIDQLTAPRPPHAKSAAFFQLPADVLLHVCGFLPPTTVLALSRLCRSFLHLTSSSRANKYWETAFCEGSNWCIPLSDLTLQRLPSSVHLKANAVLPDLRAIARFFRENRTRAVSSLWCLSKFSPLLPPPFPSVLLLR
jgi:hypothetical protein